MAEPGGPGINAEGTSPSAPPKAEKPQQKPEQLTREQKEQRWNQLRTEISQEPRNLGHELDPSILETAVALNALEINAVLAFEGLTNWAAPANWVHIGAK